MRDEGRAQTLKAGGRTQTTGLRAQKQTLVAGVKGE